MATNTQQHSQGRSLRVTRKGSPKKSVEADWSIDQLPGLSIQDQARLIDSGIHTTLQLLQQGKTSEKRIALASQLQIHIKHVNKWVALADLARIPTVGCRYCGLLLHAGVASPGHLAQTPLDRLHRQIMRLQVTNLQRRDLCPTFADVEQWSQQARLIG